MNKVLIQSATLIHPKSSFHKKVVNVLIKGEKIAEVSADEISVEKSVKVIDGKGQFLCSGFIDLNANFGEPGLETKEDIISGCDAAAAGGFTAVCVLPNTSPAIQSKSEVLYLLSKAKDCLTDVLPVGAITVNREGKELAELYDMKMAGAVAFSDGNRPVTDSGVMSRAMLYAKGFEGLVFSYPEDKTLAAKGKMNEGITSTYLGMTGLPALAEELQISRDIALAEYNDASVHFSTVSTASGVDLIRKAKAKGLKITCDVAAHHLLLTDELLTSFDSNYKVKPPLRTKADCEALIAALKDGAVDAVVSQHTPHEKEYKDVEFEIAEYGIIALQTVLPVLLAAGLDISLIAEKLTAGPKRVLKLNENKIEAGADANLVLVNTKAKWLFDGNSNKSKSSNSPYLDKELTGKVTLVYNNGQHLTY